MTRLNIGYGPDGPVGWDNADISGDIGAGISDGRDFLPFATDTVEMVYIGYGLEFIELDQVRMGLLEIQRVLEPGGCLCAIGDMPRTGGDNPAQPPWRYIPSPLEVSLGVGHVTRKWRCYLPRLSAMVADVFPNTVNASVGDLIPEWPIRSRANWQRALLAYKDK